VVSTTIRSSGGSSVAGSGAKEALEEGPRASDTPPVRPAAAHGGRSRGPGIPRRGRPRRTGSRAPGRGAGSRARRTSCRGSPGVRSRGLGPRAAGAHSVHARKTPQSRSRRHPSPPAVSPRETFSWRPR
jgi:hypothetical protein